MLVHGYLSCGATYYKMLRELSKKYNIYALDLPGMGLSSRPPFRLQDKQEILDYFTNALDDFVVSQNLTRFKLAGHSFGGYVSAQYAMRYPHKVDSLFLISPLGVTARTEDEAFQYEREMLEKSSTGFRFTYNFYKSLMEKDYTVISLSKIPFLPISFFLNRRISRWFPNNENEKWMWYDYLRNVLELPVSSDVALNRLFRPQRLTARYPLESVLPSEATFPVHFIFGDRDWMCSIGARRLIDQKLLKVRHSFTVVENSGHNIIYDNHQKLSACLMNY